MLYTERCWSGSVLDFGDSVGLFPMWVVIVFLIHAQIQPQVIQSLTHCQHPLTPVSDTDEAL